jgi:hypothetical protein
VSAGARDSALVLTRLGGVEVEMLVIAVRNRQHRWPMALTEHDRLILDFERAWWTLPGSKGSAIHQRLGMSSSSYYRSLRRLIDEPDAAAYDPLTVRRLRRQRDLRRRHRFEGRRAGPST